MKSVSVVNKKANEEKFFTHITAFAALGLLLVIAGTFSVVLWGAWPALKEFGFNFLFSAVWDPVANIYGALPVAIGTIVTSVLSLAIAAPLGIGTAIFLSELSLSWLKRPISFMVELLAAVPSVVYGVWGILCLFHGYERVLVFFWKDILGFCHFFGDLQ